MSKPNNLYKIFTYFLLSIKYQSAFLEKDIFKFNLSHYSFIIIFENVDIVNKFVNFKLFF